MYLVISLLVLRAGYGIWLYQFLIIAYLFTFLDAGLTVSDKLNKGRKSLGDKFFKATESPYHFDHLLQVSNKSLWILILYTFWNGFPHEYRDRGRPICGQNSDINRKALSLGPFVASSKHIFEVRLRARLGAHKTGLSPPVFLYWPFQGGTSVVVP